MLNRILAYVFLILAAVCAYSTYVAVSIEKYWLAALPIFFFLLFVFSARALSRRNKQLKRRYRDNTPYNYISPRIYWQREE